MKIFILRHEERDSDHSFDAPLNSSGLSRRHNLTNAINNLCINRVFSSPYKRTIQTVEPYLEMKNMKINLEYSLYESLTNDTNDNNIRELDENIYSHNRVNHNYYTFLKKRDLNYGETYEDIKIRMNNFIEHLCDTDEFKNDNILLVTHMTPINSILNRQPMSIYNQGVVSLIYDNDTRVFQQLN